MAERELTQVCPLKSLVVKGSIKTKDNSIVCSTFRQLSLFWETGHRTGAPHGDVQHGPLPGVGRSKHQHLRDSVRFLKFYYLSEYRNTEFIRFQSQGAFFLSLTACTLYLYRI